MGPEELVGRAGQEVRAQGSRRRGRRAERSGPRPRTVQAPTACARRTISATGFTVPTAFDAYPTATRRVRSESAASSDPRSRVHVARSTSISRTVAPASRGGGDPGPPVGLVVQARDHDLVAGPEHAGDRAREGERQGGHVLAELDLGRGGRPEEVGDGLVRLAQDRVAADAGGEGAVGVRVGLAVVRRHRVDDPLRHLRPARPVEEDDRAAVLLGGQRRELRAQGDGIESRHRAPRESAAGCPLPGTPIVATSIARRPLSRRPLSRARHRAGGAGPWSPRTPGS